MTSPYIHDGFTHQDGTQCVWLDGYWFVPYDVGGEGVTCEQEHPSHELDQLRKAVLAFIDDMYECDESGERLGWPSELAELVDWKHPEL